MIYELLKRIEKSYVHLSSEVNDCVVSLIRVLSTDTSQLAEG